MPRSSRIKKRVIDQDPNYQSRLVARLINCVMRSGKKSLAQKIVYLAFDQVEKSEKKESLEVFRKALENIKPVMEVRSRRVGGASYQVPVPVRGDRREALAIRWLIQSAEKRSNREFKTYDKKLAAEIIDAFHNQGGAIEKKQQVQKMAEANKAFAHFRW